MSTPTRPTVVRPIVTANTGDWTMKELGRGYYSAFLSSRDGETRLMQIPYASLEWNRVIDTFSTASLTMDADVYDMGGLTKDVKQVIDCWCYELTFFRNDERCWSGPITGWTMSEDGGLQIEAADIAVWLNRRVIHNDANFKDLDLANIAAWIVNDAMSVDNVPGLVFKSTPTKVKGDRTFKKKLYLQASDQLDELSRTGLDWTVVDRQMIVGNFEIPATPITTLTRGFFADDPEVEMLGSALGTRWLVLAGTGGDDGPQFLGEAKGGNPDVYGVHERVVNESSITDQKSASQAAATRRDALSHNPVVFGGAELDPSAPVTVDMLIPGRVISVLYDALGRELRGDYRIKAVKGISNDSNESISIDCEPIGTVEISAEAQL